MQLSDNSLKLSAAVICLLMFVLSIYPVNTSQLFKAGNNLGKIDISLFLICAALFNPNAWMHNFIFLTFAYMVSLLYLYRVKVVDKTVIFLIALSFILHSLTNSFLARSWSGNWFEIFSFVNFGAIILFIALLKIKFFHKEIRV